MQLRQNPSGLTLARCSQVVHLKNIKKVLHFTVFWQVWQNPTGLPQARCSRVVHLKKMKKYCILQPFCNVGKIPQDWHELVATGSFISKCKKSIVFYSVVQLPPKSFMLKCQTECHKNIVFYNVFATSAKSHRSATSSLQPDRSSQRVKHVLYFTMRFQLLPN